MTFTRHHSTLLLFAAVAFSWATASTAQAQFLSVRTPYGGRFNFAQYQTFQLHVYNPLTGPVNIGFASTIPFYGRNNYYGGGYYGGSYMNGGVASAYSTPYYDDRRQALARAQRGGKTYNQYEARSAITDQWAYERGSKPAVAAVNKGIPKIANTALLNAGVPEILAGVAGNDLLAAIGPLDTKSPVAVDSALLPPELATRIRFGGGPTADAVNLLRSGALDYPAQLRTPQFDEFRADLDKSFTLLGDVAGHNRDTVAVAADRLTAAVERGRDRIAPLMSGLPVPEAMELARFLNRIASTANAMKNPATGSAYVPGWSSLGVTVRELTRHMARYGLTFAPAVGLDQEEAYQVLQRGLTDYYLNLARNVK